VRLFCSDSYRFVRPDTPKFVPDELNSKLIARFRCRNFSGRIAIRRENVKMSVPTSAGCPTGPKSSHGASTTPPRSLLESGGVVQQLFRTGGASLGLFDRLKCPNRHESVSKNGNRGSSCVNSNRFGIQKVDFEH